MTNTDRWRRYDERARQLMLTARSERLTHARKCSYLLSDARESR